MQHHTGNLASPRPRRILICQQRQIGDVLLATPAMELLHKRFPEAELHVLTERKCLPVLENNPHIARIASLDKTAFPSLRHELQWYKDTARQGYDLLINFQPTLPRLHWIVFFSGAAVRLAGPVPWYLRPLYTHIAEKPGAREPSGAKDRETPRVLYAAEAKAGILAPLGITWRGERPRLYLTRDEEAEAALRLESLGLRPRHVLVTLAPAHKRATRQWPVRHYAEMAAILSGMAAREGIEPRFLPVWGPGENATVRELIALAGEHKIADRFLVPDTMLSLREMAACIGRAALHIGNCSSPRHVAVAVNTPTCIAHGATGPEWICPPRDGMPRDHVGLFAREDCQPCERNTCEKSSGEAPCLVNLTPDRMAETAFGLLSQSPKGLAASR